MNYHTSWTPLFQSFEFDSDTLDEMTGGSYYPHKHQIFRVFSMSVDKIQVVLLGQDPYHGPGQAHGLSFSVERTIRIPPSLQNIFKELRLEFPERNYVFPHGDLSKWESNGIFLLNCSLTVAPGKPGSHMDIWSEFTDATIDYISRTNTSCVFLLLGNFAKGKRSILLEAGVAKNHIVEETHPSPLAKGFIGSGVFKRVESALGREIDWSVE
jgi:uracil-DNA glycosylase